MGRVGVGEIPPQVPASAALSFARLRSTLQTVERRSALRRPGTSSASALQHHKESKIILLFNRDSIKSHEPNIGKRNAYSFI